MTRVSFFSPSNLTPILRRNYEEVGAIRSICNLRMFWTRRYSSCALKSSAVLYSYSKHNSESKIWVMTSSLELPISKIDKFSTLPFGWICSCSTTSRAPFQISPSEATTGLSMHYVWYATVDRSISAPNSGKKVQYLWKG